MANGTMSSIPGNHTSCKCYLLTRTYIVDKQTRCSTRTKRIPTEHSDGVAGSLTAARHESLLLQVSSHQIIDRQILSAPSVHLAVRDRYRIRTVGGDSTNHRRIVWV